jgi:hypothetical protein
MKKISLLTKIVFHIANITLIILYIFPGSILGWLIYGNFEKQPLITSDLSFFSLNHVYAFSILSFIGLVSFHRKNINNLFIYLFFISIFLELCHSFIPFRSFEYRDLFGNVLGVLIVYLTFNCYQFFKKKL